MIELTKKQWIAIAAVVVVAVVAAAWYLRYLPV